jgi:putative nucleotidyltransferase with HDIG domain
VGANNGSTQAIDTRPARSGKKRARALVWLGALVVAIPLATVAYFVNWAVSLAVLTVIMMCAVVLTARRARRERAGVEAGVEGRLERAARDRETIIEVLFGVLGLRDMNMTQSERVANLAAAVAWQMGLREEDVRHVKEAALLHDVGKMGIADNVLSKPDELNEEEWAEMRRHPEAGFAIMDQITSLRGVAEIIHHHHERFDGQGYPGGLKGDEIPIGSRIFAVVDSYVAMTSERPYRKKLSHEVAVKEIVRNSLTQFDPEVMAAFLQAEKHGLLTVRAPNKDGLIGSPVPSEV